MSRTPPGRRGSHPPREAPAAVVLDVHVIPRAQTTAIAGKRDGAWLVRLTAPPVDDAANEALVVFLARALGVSRRSVTIVGGERSRRKRVRIEGVETATVDARLTRAAGTASTTSHD